MMSSMMTTNIQNDKDIRKLQSITKENLKNQATWFLNTCCYNNITKSDLVYNIYKQCMEYNNKQNYSNVKSSDCCINELDAHFLLENIGKPVTQIGFHQYVQSINPSISKFDIPLLIILFFYFEVDWKVAVNESQSCIDFVEAEKARDSLHQAQKKLQDAIGAENKSLQEINEADNAMEHSRLQQESLTKAIFDCQNQEALLVEAKKLAEQALDEVLNQEKSFNQRKQDLENVFKNESNGIVTRNKARAELQIMNNEDPLPLRKAKLKNENALRKLKQSSTATKKSRVAAEDAKQKSEQAMEVANRAKTRAMEAAQIAESTIDEAKDAIESLKQRIDEIIINQTIPWGSIYFIDREVREAEKFLPKNKLKKFKEAAEETKKRISTPPRERLYDKNRILL